MVLAFTVFCWELTSTGRQNFLQSVTVVNQFPEVQGVCKLVPCCVCISFLNARTLRSCSYFNGHQES